MTDRPQKEDTQLAPEMEDLAQEIGQFMEYWGFKKVHGEIWCHLFLSKQGLDAAELMARLKISKALVSISLKELQEFQVIEEVGKTDRGTRLYVAKPDIVTPIVDTIRRRERRMMARIESAHSLLSRLPESERARMDIDWNRVNYLGQLIEIANAGLENLIKKKWQNFSEFFFLRRRYTSLNSRIGNHNNTHPSTNDSPEHREESH